MILTETHIIKGSKELDEITFKCKNLYNRANFLIRQEFIDNGKYISKIDMFNNLKTDPDYMAMPTRVSRCVLRTLDGNWKGFLPQLKTGKLIKGNIKENQTYRNIYQKMVNSMLSL